MRLLLAEDDTSLQDVIARGLREQSYIVTVVSDGDAALLAAITGRYDALILDIMLPYRSGLDVCAELLSRGQHTPILLLTARDSLDDKVLGLDAGADDYLTKPFAIRELLARLRALGRRRGNVSPTVGAVNFDQHGDSTGAPNSYIGYDKGTRVEADSGTLVAAMDGGHGWFWRNRSGRNVVVRLIVSGEYAEIKRYF